jgi:glutamyl-tRNA synthetase
VKAYLDKLGVPEDQGEEFWTAIRENLSRMEDAAEWWALCQNGATPVVEAEDRDFVLAALEALPEPPYTSESWGDWTKALKENSGRKGKGLFMPLRRALTGQAHGPDMSQLMPLLQRVNRTLDK